jgi:hypothetical protein
VNALPKEEAGGLSGVADTPHNRASLAAEALGGVLWTNAIHTRVEVRVSFLDRLRILFHGKLNLRMQTKTQFNPGQTLSGSEVYVPRVFPGLRRPEASAMFSDAPRGKLEP